MLHSLPDFSHSVCYPQSNWAPLVLIPDGWACARSRPLWVSPTTSLVRLRVSPAAASTPADVFNQRFEALFPQAGALGCLVCFTPLLFLLVYLCTNVGPQGLLATSLWGLLAAAWPAQFHNPPPRWVRQSPPCHESSPSLLPVSAPLPVWMNVSSFSPWLSDSHTVQFSVSSGCFLFLNLLFFFWLCKEAKYIYLCFYLGQKSWNFIVLRYL